MKTLVVAQQKGGVGKTSSVVHLAFDFLERGLKVAVIDADVQGNASDTLKAFKLPIKASDLFQPIGTDTWEGARPEEGDTPSIGLFAADPKLANTVFMDSKALIETFAENVKTIGELGFDVCLIDTAPGLTITLTAVLHAGDYVLSPIELEKYSITGIKAMMTVIGNVKKTHKLIFMGMVPSKVDSRNPRHGRHQTELQAAFPQYMVPASIGLRSSIADALASGVPVWKIKKTTARKAAKEVRELAQYVFEKMEIA